MDRLSGARSTTAWTYVNASSLAQSSGNDCASWTSNAFSFVSGEYGNRGNTNSLWTDNTAGNCASSISLYCFQQDGTAGASGCASPSGMTGEIIYNSSENITQGCTENGWVELHEVGSGGGGCANPTGTNGEVIYNSTSNVFQSCSTNGWSALH